QPPCSTLFPYTTLFRSPHQIANRGLKSSPTIRVVPKLVHGCCGGGQQHRVTVHRELRREPHGTRHHPISVGLFHLKKRQLRRVSDRKSTRLNSSHVKIS